MPVPIWGVAFLVARLDGRHGKQDCHLLACLRNATHCPTAYIHQVFFCGGRIMMGRSWKAVPGTAFTFLGPTVINLVFVAPYLSRQVHPALLAFR